MTYGPCGGVAADGACELGDRICVFLGDGAPAAWAGAVATRRVPDDPLLALAAVRPIVVADLPDRSLDPDSTRRAAGALAGVADAALFGDTGPARVQLPPAYRARLVATEGLRPWAGVNCRDRNRVALEAEVYALADVGAVIHCITGDHTDLGGRPDAKPVFDLDSTQLAALANGAGLLVSVAENPVAPPIDQRPARVAQKAKAGAHVCIVNHAGTAERVHAFVDAARRQPGAEHLVFLACVPLVTSAEGLALLRTFTGLALPPGFAEAIDGAAHPFVAGVDQAVRFATAVLDVPGVIGVNLSAAYPPSVEDESIAAVRAVAGALGAG